MLIRHVDNTHPNIPMVETMVPQMDRQGLTIPTHPILLRTQPPADPCSNTLRAITVEDIAVAVSEAASPTGAAIELASRMHTGVLGTKAPPEGITRILTMGGSTIQVHKVTAAMATRTPWTLKPLPSGRLKTHG